MRGVALLFALLSMSCRSALVPSHGFDEETPPPAPDYAREDAWAALPGRADDADVVPAGEVDGQAEAAVDVFFLHPTTYYSNEHWNQPLDDATANAFTDEKVLRNQASAFNAAGRVYAPRYRQATLGTFVTKQTDDASAALELAYGDVLAAFDYYLAHYNDGRPIIVASHSQGSRHAVRLLADRFAGTALAERLVAAYPIGFAIPTDHFERTLPPIGPCRTATDTGCLVTWSAWVEGAEPENLRDAHLTIPYDGEFESMAGKPLHCTNPLDWNGGVHVGAVRFRGSDVAPEPDRAYVETARCDNALFVGLPDRKYRGAGKNLHLYDYSLFYMDLRANAAARAAAFVAATTPASPAAPSTE